jgi:hypothetical protein
MSRKSGDFKRVNFDCPCCVFSAKQNALLVCHAKEAHGIEF